MRNNLKTQDQYIVCERNNQLVLVLNSEILLPEDAPVRVTSAQLEEPDYRKLYEAYSFRGIKSVTDPRVMFNININNLLNKFEFICLYYNAHI